MARVKREPRGFVLATSTHNRTACQAVLKNNVDVLNSGERTGSRVKLMNTMMQLRKCCNHPYLFDGVEDKTLDPFGDHLVTHSGKLVLLDKLLPRLQSKGSRVLIFSQMVRGFTFCNCKFCIVF
jgi:SWI/SNF-related matrix-associated actin-dependent regulator of chromatin subfamily A member 5